MHLIFITFLGLTLHTSYSYKSICFQPAYFEIQKHYKMKVKEKQTEPKVKSNITLVSKYLIAQRRLWCQIRNLFRLNNYVSCLIFL